MNVTFVAMGAGVPVDAIDGKVIEMKRYAYGEMNRN